MSWRERFKHPILSGVVVAVIAAPFTLFSDVIRAGVVAFFTGIWSLICTTSVGFWNGICAVGRWLATPVVVPLWLIFGSVIAFLVCLKVARVFRARALAVEDRTATAPAEGQAVPPPLEPVEPEFQPTVAQQRIIERLARAHPGSEGLTELHYASRLPTQAHTEREAEGLAEAGIIEIGSNYVSGTWYALTREGRNYALDNGLFPGARR
jgi:hypothetical protein